jgi:hypothetical protein
MKRHARRASRTVTGLALAVVLSALPSPAPGEGHEVHGENSVFAGHGVAIAWGVLKTAVEEETQVVIRIIPAGESFAAVRVEAVDPFTQRRQVVLDGRPLTDALDVRGLRAAFADFPRREIQLYRTAADWQARRPTVTVYYLGVPDTTPEFTSEAALFAYLSQALAKVQGAGGGKRP